VTAGPFTICRRRWHRCHQASIGEYIRL